MAARFPVSASAAAYQIPAAWSSKVLAVFWPASADSVHRLYPGDTLTTIITRAASGATYNSTEGRIEGTSTTMFTDGKSGGYGGLKENGNFVFGASYYGDLFNGLTPITMMWTGGNVPSFTNGAGFSAGPYGVGYGVRDNSIDGIPSGTGDDVLGIVSLGVRRNLADGTGTTRGWFNGAEVVTTNQSVTNAEDIGTVARPLYFGSTGTGTGNTKLWAEAWWFGTGMSDADMAAITANPSIVVEAAGGGGAAASLMLPSRGRRFANLLSV